MSRNTLIGRLLTPAGFASALALFLLPFLTFSCAGPSTPSEDIPISSDSGITATYSALDLILDGDPTVELRQDGTVVTIDPSELPADPSAPAEEDEEPVPMKLRAPTIGAAAVLVVGLLLALITGNAARRLLATLAALAAAGALAYVIYFAAPDYLKEANADMTSEGVSLDVTLESAPAIGFWAIIGVLAVVVLLQLVPTPPPAPAASPTPPPGQYGVPAQPGEASAPVAGNPPAGPASY